MGFDVKLSLGVFNVPYESEEKKRFFEGNDSLHTTHEVAEFLEQQYGVMEAYAQSHNQTLTNCIANGFFNVLEEVVSGKMQSNPFETGLEEIREDFQRFLTSYEAERVNIPGTPTLDALRGVIRRYNVYEGPRRPSFVATGLYKESFAAQIEEAFDITHGIEKPEWL